MPYAGYAAYPYAFSAGAVDVYGGRRPGFDEYEISQPVHFIPPVIFACFIVFFTTAERSMIRKPCGGEYYFLLWFPVAILLGTGLIIGAWLREDFEEEEKRRLTDARTAATNARMTTVESTSTGVDAFDDTAVMREQIERARAVARPTAFTVGAPPPGTSARATPRQQAGRLVGSRTARDGRGAAAPGIAPAGQPGAKPAGAPQTYRQVNGVLVASGALDEQRRRMELETPWENPFMWDTVYNTVVVPALGFVAGLVVAVIGVGGGWLVAPYLVGIMKKPEPARAIGLASAVMIVVQAAICFQYLIINRLYFSYSLYFGLVALASGIGGWYLTALVVERLKEKSRIMFALCATIAFMVVWTFINGLTHTQFSSRAIGFSAKAACLAGRE